MTVTRKMSFGVNEGPDYEDLQRDEYGVQDTDSPGGHGTQETDVTDREREAVDLFLRPVNIAQILMANQTYFMEDQYTLEGHPISKVTVVAKDRSVVARTTWNEYKLDDGSAQIDALHSVQSIGSGDVDAKQCALGYVQVTGTIRAFHDYRHIDASTIRILEDPMEAFFHLNKVLAASMIYKRDLPNAPTSTKIPPATSSGSTSSDVAATIVPLDEYPYLGPVENAIMRYFQANPSVHGHHLRDILYGTQKIAPESMSGPRDEQLQTLRIAIDNLAQQGLLFSTWDEQHYALC